MINDLTMLGFSEAAYTETPDITVNDTFILVRQINGVTVFAARGTNPERIADDLTDIDAVPYNDKTLGDCHKGFAADAYAVVDAIANVRVEGSKAFTGHSKGAGDSAMIAALLVSMGHEISQLTTFGLPRCGRLNGLLGSVPGSDFWNGDDPVPTLPIWLEHPRAMTAIGEHRFKLDVINDHYITAYRASLENLVK